jgi:hypothetical protein
VSELSKNKVLSLPGRLPAPTCGGLQSSRLRKKKFDGKKKITDSNGEVTAKSHDSSVLLSSSSDLAFTNVKAGEAPPPLCKLKNLIPEIPKPEPEEEPQPKQKAEGNENGKKSGHFSETIEEKDAGTNQQILEVLKELKLPGFNPYQFIQAKKDAHPKALLHVLSRLSREGPVLKTIKSPWAYAEKILRIERKNYTETDAIAAHQRLMEEFKKQYPREQYQSVEDDPP